MSESIPNSPSLPESSSPPPPRRLRLKLVLGCFGGLLLLTIALVLVAPMMVSGEAKSALESAVNEEVQGSLQVESLSLAWFGEQRVENAVIVDPQGKTVARVSARLPSLWSLLHSGGSRIGKVRIELEADLVADDAGVTNLQRAFAERPKPPADPHAKAEKEDDSPESSFVEDLAKLDLDLELVGKRLSWSDAETRKLGRPFELSNLKLVASAKPGAPITVKAGAQVAGETAGAFEIDARVNGPIRSGQAWPFGTIEARGDIRGFSSALVDGLAGQQGRLRELLGPSFDLTFSARDVTSEKGEITAELVSPASRLKLAARLDNGVVRAQTDKLLEATIALPRAYLDAFVIPKLPPGSKLDFGARAQPWSVRIDAFELALPKGAKMDLASLAPELENATCHFFASLASPIGFENEQTRIAFGRACSLEGTQLELSIAPKTAPSLKLTSSLVADGRSPITIEASSKDAWRALSKSEVPHVDAHVELADVPVAALDAFAGTQGRLAQGLGDRLRVVVTATDASLDRGTIQASVKSPRLELDAPLEVASGSLVNAKQAPIRMKLDAPAGWVDGWLAGKLPEGMELVTQAGAIELSIRELNVPLPAPGTSAASTSASSDALRDLRKHTSAALSLKTPALRWSNAALRAEQLSVALAAPQINASLALDGQARFALTSALDTGVPGQIAVQASVADAWAALAPDGTFHVPPIDATAELRGVSPALLAALSGQGARVRDALGGALDLKLDAKQLDGKNGALSASVNAPRLRAQLDARLENGVLRSTKDAGLALNASPDAGFVQRELAAFLPADTQLAFASDGGGLTIALFDLDVRLPDFANAEPVQTLALLESARASLRASVKRLSYADASTRAAKTDVALEDLVLATQLAPKQAARVDIDAALVTSSSGNASERGTLHADATIADPWFALREGSKSMPSLDATLKLTNVPTRTLDAFAGAQDLVSKLLGPTLELDMSAKRASLEGGEITLSAKSPTTDLRVSGALANSTFVASGEQGLALSIRLPAGWLEQQITPKLPAGARLSLPTDVQPLTLSAKELRIPLATSASATPPANTPRSLAAPGARKNPPAAAAPPTNSAESNAEASQALFERLAGLAAQIELSVPEITYADANTDAAGQPIVIRGLRASAALAPDAQPFVKVNATVQSQAPGELAADVRALDPLRTLSEEQGLERFRVSCDVRAKGLPTALVDALAGQGGLLVEALGARVDVSVKSESLSMTTGSFVADMTSDLHSVRCEGSMQERVLRIQKQDGIAARIGLGPVTNERVVGRLVPMLVDLQKPEGATPAILAVDSMNFPFDGGLRGLDADVRVDLGEVSANLLPGLDKVLGDAVGLKSLRVPALSIPIRKGVAAYKDVPFQLGGQTLKFNGSFDLSELTLRFDTAIPLRALGKKFSKDLDKVREYVSPDLAVPIEIRGNWKHPKVEIPSSFVGKLVEDAAKKGLGGLLDGLLKKKD